MSPRELNLLGDVVEVVDALPPGGRARDQVGDAAHIGQARIPTDARRRQVKWSLTQIGTIDNFDLKSRALKKLK